MVPYPERWMDRIDTVRAIMGWGSTSITYFYDLAIHGERSCGYSLRQLE